MINSTLVEHWLIAAVAWLAGMILGGIAAYLCALLGRRLFSLWSGWHKLFILLPWRTIVINLLLFILLFLSQRAVLVNLLQLAGPEFAVLFRDLGIVVLLLEVGLLLALLTWPLMTVLLLEYWYPSSLLVRLTAGARTLATVSIASVVIVGFFSGQGMGATIERQIGLMDLEGALNSWLVIILTMLLADLLPGIIQVIIALMTETTPPNLNSAKP